MATSQWTLSGTRTCPLSPNNTAPPGTPNNNVSSLLQAPQEKLLGQGLTRRSTVMEARPAPLPYTGATLKGRAFRGTRTGPWPCLLMATEVCMATRKYLFASVSLFALPVGELRGKKMAAHLWRGFGTTWCGFCGLISLPATASVDLTYYFFWLPFLSATPPLQLQGPRDRLIRTAAPIWSAFKGFHKFPHFILSKTPRGDEVSASHTGENPPRTPGTKGT